MKKRGKRQFGSRILAGMIVLSVCGCAGRIPQEKRAAIGSDYMEIYGGNTITGQAILQMQVESFIM